MTTLNTTSQTATGSFSALALHLPKGWHKMSLPQKLATRKLVEQQGLTADEAAAQVLGDYPATKAINAATGIKASSKQVNGSWQPIAKDGKGRLVWLWNTYHASRAGAAAMAASHIREAQAQAGSQ